MQKRHFALFMLLTCSSALALSAVALVARTGFLSGRTKASEETRSITIDTTTNVLTESKTFVESTATLKTDQLKNDIGFKFKAKLNDDEASYNLKAGDVEKAYIMNVASSPIGNIKTIEVNKISGDYNSYVIEYGWDLDGEGKVIYENSVNNYLETETRPSYFRISLDYDYGYNSMIESIVITYSSNCQEPADNPYVSEEGIKYLLYNDHAEVAGLVDSETKNVTLKALVSGKPVTTIGESAFSNAGIETVVLNASITTIARYAFNRCASLESVVGCGGVTTIGYEAFYECRKMITIPFEGDVIKTIGDRAFQSCNLMASELNFGAQVTSIGNSAFRYCNAITTLIFDDDCELQGFSKGFESDMVGLTTVHIGENMTDPYGMTQAWYSDTALETFTIGTDGIENTTYKVIDNAVYRKLENNKLRLLFILQAAGNSYVMPSNVTEINNYLCYDNQTIETVDLRNFEGTNIPYCAFQGDSNLSTVKLGKVAEIEGYAFSSCSSLTQIEFGGTTAEWELVNLGDGWSSYSAIASIVCTDGTISVNS